MRTGGDNFGCNFSPPLLKGEYKGDFEAGENEGQVDNTFSVLYTILASQRGVPFGFAANVSKTETFKVGGLHKGIDDPGNRIGCNSAFQTEHHHLVSLLACNVWHIFLFF